MRIVGKRKEKKPFSGSFQRIRRWSENGFVCLRHILFFAWIVEMLFHAPIILPANLTKPLKKPRLQNIENQGTEMLYPDNTYRDVIRHSSQWCQQSAAFSYPVRNGAHLDMAVGFIEYKAADELLEGSAAEVVADFSQPTEQRLVCFTGNPRYTWWALPGNITLRIGADACLFSLHPLLNTVPGNFRMLKDAKTVTALIVFSLLKAGGEIWFLLH